MREFTLGDIIGTAVICVLVGIFFGVIFIASHNNETIGELGQVICEKEYGMDFDNYVGGILHCKTGKPTYEYGELKIQLDYG